MYASPLGAWEREKRQTKTPRAPSEAGVRLRVKVSYAVVVSRCDSESWADNRKVKGG